MENLSYDDLTEYATAVKRFIDESFETYKPTADYPGTSFGFNYSYRRHLLQQAEAVERTSYRRKKAKEETPSLSELSDWL